MALSGSFNGTFSGISSSNAKPHITWSAVQDIAGNYSDVTLNLFFQTYNGYNAFNNANNHNCNIIVNGNANSAVANFTVNANTNVLIRSRTVRVDHNSDGTKTCNLSSDGNPQVGWGTYNFNQTIELDTIPREAFVTNAVSFQVGNNIPLTLTNSGNLFVRSELYVNNTLIKTTDHGQTASTTITLNAGNNTSIYNQMVSVTSVAMYVRIKTYSNAGYTVVVGGNRDQAGTTSIDTVLNKPTFTTFTLANVDKTINVVDKYSNTLISSSTLTLSGASTRAIKSYSKVRGTITVANKAVPQNSATMSKYRLTNGSQFSEQNFSNVATVDVDIDNVETNSYSMLAFDSRSLSTSVAGSLTIFANFTPITIFNTTLIRDNSVDAPTKLAFSGLFWNKYFSSDTTTNPGSGVLNALTAQYRWRLSTRSAFQALDGTVTITIATPAVLTKTAHGLTTGDQVSFDTTGALPTGLVAGTIYYVIFVGANTFRVATSLVNANAGTAITTTGSQSGTHTLRVDGRWTTIVPTVDASGNVSFDAYINGDLGAGGFSTDKSFIVEIREFDRLSSVIVESTLSVGTPLIDFFRESANTGVAFNSKYDSVEGGSIQLYANDIAKLFRAGMLNGRLDITVTSNNLTVAIKHITGGDPSILKPVVFNINGVSRYLRSPLLITRNAGTNWLGAGSAEMATYEIDYFAYIGFNTTDGITLGFARLPCFRRYSDINTTTTDPLHMAISTITNASGEDAYENIGRFSATLSAGAGFTWTVPTFNRVNLVNSPIYESRFLTYKPTWSANGSMTFTSVTPTTNRYEVISNNCLIGFNGIGTVGGTLNTTLIATSPFKNLDADSNPIVGGYNSQGFSGLLQPTFNSTNVIFYRSTGANYTAGSGVQVSGGLLYRIF